MRDYTVICEKCGQVNETDARFCAKCGSQIETMQQPGTYAKTDEQPLPQGEAHSPSFDLSAYYADREGANFQTSGDMQGSSGINPQDSFAEGSQENIQNHAEYGYQAIPMNHPIMEQQMNSGARASRRGIKSSRKDLKAPGEAKKKLPLVKIAIFAAPAIVIIVAAVILIPMIFSSSIDMRKDDISIFSVGDQIYISGNNKSKFTIDGRLGHWDMSIDGSKAALMVYHDDVSDNRGYSIYDLWFVTTTDAYLIAYDVEWFILADSGNGIVYFTDPVFDDDYHSYILEMQLHLYDTSSKRETYSTYLYEEQGENYYEILDVDDGFGFAISPDGKSVAFISGNDTGDNGFSCYVSIDGKSATKLEDMAFPIAISNGGKYIYYVKEVDSYNWSLHVRSGGNDVRLESGASNLFGIMFSKDYSEMIYGSVWDSEGRSFISRNGNQRERIGGNLINDILVPNGAQSKSAYDVGTVYGVSSFSDFVAYSDEEGLAYYNDRLQPTKIPSSMIIRYFLGIPSGYYDAQVSNDGKTLYYLDDSNRLWKVDLTSPNAERTRIATNVENFYAANDGKSVYYITERDELFFAGSSGDSVKVASDVYGATISYSDNSLFFLSEYRSNRGGDLYYIDSKQRMVGVVGAYDVIGVWCTPTGAFYGTVDGEIYRSNGNDKFTLFCEDADGVHRIY